MSSSDLHEGSQYDKNNNTNSDSNNNNDNNTQQNNEPIRDADANEISFYRQLSATATINNNNNAPDANDDDDGGAVAASSPTAPPPPPPPPVIVEKAKPKKKKTPFAPKPLPPMMTRRDVHSFNIVAAVICGVLGPGLIVLDSMLASAAAAVAPHGTALFGAIAGIFIPVGIILVIVPVYFFFFSGKIFSIYKISTKPDSIKTGGGGEGGEEDVDDEDEINDNNGGGVPDLEEPTCLQLILRWIFRIFFVLFVTICIIVGIFTFTVYSMKVNVPRWNVDYSHVTAPSGNQVALQRDDNGVPHIFAKTKRDAFFAFGFAQAQDRLFQLELVRLIGKGSLAKYAGAGSALDIDKLMRTLRIKESSDKMCDKVSATITEYLQDFANGINAYLENEFARPAEFLFLGQMLEFHEPEPFTVKDICLFTKLLQFQLAGSQFSTERRRTVNFFSQDLPTPINYDNFAAYFFNRINTDNASTPFSLADLGITTGSTEYNDAIAFDEESAALEKRLYDEVLFPKYRTTSSTGNTAPKSVHEDNNQAVGSKFGSSSSTSTSTTSASISSQNQHQQQQETSLFFSTKAILDGLMGDIGIIGGVDASNAWAGRAANGDAIHASDPHLENNLPCVWYFAHIYISDEDLHMAGATSPGLPIIINGRSNNIRIGNTLSLTDQGDLFFMVADTANPDTHYMHDGTSKAYTIYTETIQVKGASDFTLKVYVAPEYGPDVAQVYSLLPNGGSSRASDGTPIRICAYVNPIQEDDDGSTIEAIFNMTALASTTTVSDIRGFAQKIISPGLGMVFSDESGGIGTAITARHKIRAKGHTGRIPTLGNGSFDYTGTVPLADNPSKVDTTTASSGFVWAANSRPYPTGYKYPLGFDYSQYRERVLDDALSSISLTAPSDLSSVTFHKNLQQNKTSGFWTFGVLKDLALTSTTSDLGAAFDSQLDTAGRNRWSELKNWNGEAAQGSTEASDLWLWIFTLVVKADALIANDYAYQSASYIVPYACGLIGNPTPRQITFCGNELSESSPDSRSCARWAATVWNSAVAGKHGKQSWATAESNLFSSFYIKHMILHGSIAQGLFSRKMIKGGDPTSLDVLKLKKGDSEDNPNGVPVIAVEGPSARWVFQNVNASNDNENIGFYYNFPAGNSGNVFTDYYFDCASDYQDGRYREMKHFTGVFGDEDKRQILG